MEELKPCPFCGAKCEVSPKETASRYKIIAPHKEDCIFSMMGWWGFFETENDAVKAWNQRIA